MHKFKHVVRPFCFLLLLTAAAILIHGYHAGIEDQDVYLAAVNKSLNPNLYPVNSVFFTEQMKGSLFVRGVAGTIRLTGMSVPWALLLWQVGSIFLVLLGCWKVASICFESEAARWAGLLLVTVTLTLPIAGTSLFLIDPYLHPRALATGAILMALAAILKKEKIASSAWLLVAAAVHPLMALFGISLVVFCGVDNLEKWIPNPATASFALLPLGLLGPPSLAWKEAALARRYYFPLMWTWYEWLGAIAPVVLVWWFARVARRKQMPELERLSVRLLAFAVFQFVAAALMTFFPMTEQLSSYQPMRWLHIFYFLFLLIMGGLLGQFVLQRKAWRWLILFVPLASTMFYVQRDTFHYSDHIEWPSSAPKNPWAKAFVWSREYTPQDAVFAIDPNYMSLHAEEGYGMRALSKRSFLAENHKDPGAATVFPELAAVWRDQVHAQKGIERFGTSQFHELNRRYGVSWAILPATAVVPLECPYRNEAAEVCKVN